MSGSDDLHEVVLKWPHTDANEVIVTGTFDQWSSSVRLSRTTSGFEAPVRIPWSDKIAYKFIVDGKWMTSDSAPTEADSSGFINNAYTAPHKPAPAEVVEAPPAPETVKEEPKATEAESTAETTEPKQNGVTGAFSRAASAFHETFVAPAVEFASQMDSGYDVATPSATEAPYESAAEAKTAAPSAAEKAQKTAAPVVEKTAQVAPRVEEMEERSAEVSQPVPSVVPEPEPERMKTLSTDTSALAPTAPISMVPIHTSQPQVEVVTGSTVVPAEPEPVEASTHFQSPRAAAAPTSKATEAEARETVAAVETAAAGPPVVEVLPTGDVMTPELAPPVVEAPAGLPKEVAPADTTAVVETAAAPATEEVPVAAAVEVVEERKEEAPEVLAAPPVEAEGAKEIEEVVAVQAEEPKAEEPKEPQVEEPLAATEGQAEVARAVATPLPETPAEPDKVEEPATNGTSEAKPAPAAETNGANGTVNGKGKGSSDHRKASSFISALGSKKDKQTFPTGDGESQTASSRHGSQRKKRNSIFGKIKGIFHQKDQTK